MSEGFIQLKYELLREEKFVSLPPSYRCVMWTILAYCCFDDCTQDDHGVDVKLKRGQFMCTIRRLAELSNVGKKDAENGLKRLIELGFLGQHLGHIKSVFTVLWGIYYNDGGTRKETSWRQDGDTKEQNNKTRPVVSVKEQQQADASVVVFSCLEKLKDSSITLKDKASLTAAYITKERVVIEAVKVVTATGFVPQHTLLKSLRAACKGEWKLEKAQDDFEKNKTLAQRLEGEHNRYRFEALSKHLEIIKGVKVDTVLYTMSYEKFYSDVELKGKINIKTEIEE